MKKLLKDFLFSVAIVAVVGIVILTAFPRMKYDVPLEPLAAVATPAPPAFIQPLEELANGLQPMPSEAQILVMNFWEPYCPTCLLVLGELDQLGQDRSDVVIVAITREADPETLVEAFVNAEIQDRVHFGLFSGYTGDMIFQGVPHTHILFRDDSGAWQLQPDGTWRGPVTSDILKAYIATLERENHQL